MLPRRPRWRRHSACPSTQRSYPNRNVQPSRKHVASGAWSLWWGADVSRETADVCLLHDDLTRLPWAIELAKRTGRTVHQNLFWAFGYNFVGVGLAAFGWLNPMIAAVAMIGSSFFVVSNSLRLAQPLAGDAVWNQAPIDTAGKVKHPAESRIRLARATISK